MLNPLNSLEALEAAILQLLLKEGLEVEEMSLKVRPNGIISFRANIVPEAIVTEESFNQDEYDRIFQEIIGDF